MSRFALGRIIRVAWALFLVLTIVGGCSGGSNTPVAPNLDNAPSARDSGKENPPPVGLNAMNGVPIGGTIPNRREYADDEVMVVLHQGITTPANSILQGWPLNLV